MFCKKFCKMFCRKCFAENVLQKCFEENVLHNVLQKSFAGKPSHKCFAKMFCKKFCRKCFAENVSQKMFCKNVLQKKFCRKAFAKSFAKCFAKISLSQGSFPETVFFFFPFSNTKLKNTSSLLVLHYQYPQQCGDRSHQVDDQEYLWPRPENAKGCSLCFLREINRTNFLRQYVFLAQATILLHIINLYFSFL